jgi:hypothetical protein
MLMDMASFMPGAEHQPAVRLHRYWALTADEVDDVDLSLTLTKPQMLGMPAGHGLDDIGHTGAVAVYATLRTHAAMTVIGEHVLREYLVRGDGRSCRPNGGGPPTVSACVDGPRCQAALRLRVTR